jgi:hypothetical protein
MERQGGEKRRRHRKRRLRRLYVTQTLFNIREPIFDRIQPRENLVHEFCRD